MLDLAPYLAVQTATARVLAESETLAFALPRILEGIGRAASWDLGVAWTLDERSALMRCEALWRAPGLKMPRFEEMTRSRTFTPGVGLPGRVWQKGEPLWISDVTVDDGFPRARVAFEEGLHGCCGFPIKLGSEILGVLEFFARDTKPLDQGLLDMMDTLGHQIGQFMKRARAQAALRESESRFRDLVESLDAIVWEADPESLQVRFVSQRAERMLGYPTGEWLRQPDFWVRLIHPDDRHLALGLWRQAVREGRGKVLEYRVVAKDGRVVWLRDEVYVVRDAAGRVDRLRGMMTDITERKQREEERSALLQREQRARADAELASRAKDEFLAMISHELRTPLTSILGWTRMLRIGKHDRAATARALATVERNGQALGQLIEDLLDVARITSGKLTLDLRTVEPLPVVEAALEAVRPSARAKGIRLDETLDPEAGPIEGDPDRLQQVASNLLSNAIKFTPAGGQVEVRLERTDHQVAITIRDSGEGIRPEFLPYVFDRFRQDHASATYAPGGLGLGLAIVRHLVEMHGGSVTADSGGEGQGATFRVLLPLAQRAARAEPTTAPPVRREPDASLPSLGGLKLLVVDDEPDTLELLRSVLEECGAEVRTASSAAEALRTLLKWRAHILVSDIGMAGEDGFALIRKVRALKPERGGRVPAVALTGYARVQDRMQVLAAGFQMHVPKPVDPAELATVIASLALRTGRPKAVKRLGKP